MTNEWSVVAILYVCKENNVKICRATFILYKAGASVEGCNFVLRNVGIKAITSIVTTIIIETVGSFNIIQGIRPSNAKIRKYVSVFVMCLNPYCRENRKIIMVNDSATPVGSAPIPAPFTSCPKNVTPETIDHTNHVYGCGLTLLERTSRKYEILPTIAKIVATMAKVSFMRKV